MHKLAKFIFYKLLGWKLEGSFPKIDKCVAIVVPHTSNMDFFLGLLVRRVLNEKFNFVAKKSLFKAPWGWYFRWLGGMPIDRSKSNNFVEACAKLISNSDKIYLTIAPEGTRSKVGKWKTGFYYIAKTANVPIVLVAFDYGRNTIKVSEAIHTTDDLKQDFETYHTFFEGVIGKVPINS